MLIEPFYKLSFFADLTKKLYNNVKAETKKIFIFMNCHHANELQKLR